MKIQHLILAVCLLSSWLSASDIEIALMQLASKSYEEQLLARNALLSYCSKVTQADVLDSNLQAQFEAKFWREINNHSLPLENRLYLIRMLEWFGSNQSTDTLLGFMNHSDPYIADASRSALKSIDPLSLNNYALEQLSSDSGTKIKLAMIDSLDAAGSHQSLSNLFELLDSKIPAVRVATIIACGRLADRRAIEPLLFAYESLATSERILAEHALIKIGLDAKTAHFIFEHAVAESAKATAYNVLLQLDPKLAASHLDVIIEDPNYLGRTLLFASVLRSNVDGLKVRLFNYLLEADQASQLTIVHLAGTLELVEQEALLLTLLETSEHDAIKHAVVEVLGKIGTDASYPAIYREFLLKPKQAIYSEAIGELKAVALDKQVTSDALKGTIDEKIAAIKILKLRNVVGATKILNSMLQNVNSLERPLAQEVLSALEVLGNDRSIQLLLNSICQKGPYLKLAQKSLYRLSSRYGVAQNQWDDFYYPMRSGKNSATCQADIVDILAAVPCEGSLEYITQILFDPNSALKKNAMRTMLRWPIEPNLKVCFLWLRLIESGILSTQDTTRAYAQVKKSLLMRHHEFSLAQGKLLVAIVQSSIPLEIRKELLSVYNDPRNHFYRGHFRSKVAKLLQPLTANEQLGNEVQAFIDSLKG